jgi:hypothetical protein
MRHYIENGQYNIDIDYSVKKDLKSFKQEVLDYVYNLYEEHGNLPLLFSGGNDSTFILRTLIELGIKPDLHTIVFTRRTDTSFHERIRDVCKAFSCKLPEFTYIDKNEIIKHAEYLIEEKNIGYPMGHGFNIDYFLNKYKDINFMSGMGSEFKCIMGVISLPPGPWIVKCHNPGRIFDFTSSRTFLSYVNNSIFKTEYTKPVFTKPGLTSLHDKLYIRDLIYNDCYEGLNLPPKASAPIADWDRSKMSNIILTKVRFKIPNMHWSNLKPFEFDVNKYFEITPPKENNDS